MLLAQAMVVLLRVQDLPRNHLLLPLRQPFAIRAILTAIVPDQNRATRDSLFFTFNTNNTVLVVFKWALTLA